MNMGKLKESSFRLSVCKPLGKQNKVSLYDSTFGLDGLDGQKILASSCVVTGEDEKLCALAIYRASNALALKGAKPSQAALMMSVPEDMSNDLLFAMSQAAAGASTKTGCRICSFDVTVGAVTACTVSVTVMGPAASAFSQAGPADGASTLVMFGHTAHAGAAMLAGVHYAELSGRLPSGLLTKTVDSFSEIYYGNSVELLQGGIYHPVADGGVFGALWELCEVLGCGCEVDAAAIPIEQSTVEVCELLDVSPYQMRGDGAYIAVLSEEAAACSQGRIIGRITSSNSRLITVGEEKRFLEPNRTDTFFSVKR